MATSLFAITLVIIATIIGSFGGLFLKKGSSRVSFNLKNWLTNYYLYLGGTFYGASSIFSIIALKFGELSVLYPFASLTYIWIALLSKFILKEKINIWKYIGIAFILIGVSFIGLGS